MNFENCRFFLEASDKCVLKVPMLPNQSGLCMCRLCYCTVCARVRAGCCLGVHKGARPSGCTHGLGCMCQLGYPQRCAHHADVSHPLLLSHTLLAIRDGIHIGGNVRPLQGRQDHAALPPLPHPRAAFLSCPCECTEANTTYACSDIG